MPDVMRDYRPAGPTLKVFHESTAFVRGIRGPLGSGKSTACVVEILRRAQLQAPGPDGKRKSRWAIIRNTYPELTTTTIPTWQIWCPAGFGKFNMASPPSHRIKSGELDIEVLFLALDSSEDVRKLLSMELTGAWINEAREIPKAILDALTGRVGRFPSMADGGPTWSGVLLDTNPPDADGWWYRLAEDETPEGWEFFSQPAGDSAEAENVPNLPANYYDKLATGKDPDWLKVYVGGNYGYVIDGKPIYPEWRDSVHVTKEPVIPETTLPLYIGVDFGLTPAAVFAQVFADGTWRVVDELCTADMGVIRFSELLTKRLAENFPEHSKANIHVWCDPAGNTRSQNDEKTAMQIMREHTGLKMRPAPSNEFTMRREAVGQALSRLVDGKPGLMLSPQCTMLRKGFAGGYCYRRLKVAGDERYKDKPDKGRYSHPHDALQYLLLGGGEGYVVLHREERRRRRAGQHHETAEMMTTPWG